MSNFMLSNNDSKNANSKKLIFSNSRNITFLQYFKNKVFCFKRKLKNDLISTKLKAYLLCQKYFKDKLDILKYFDLHNKFKHFIKLFLDKEERKLLKTMTPKLNKYQRNRNYCNREFIIMNDSKISLNMNTQDLKPKNNSEPSLNSNPLAQEIPAII